MKAENSWERERRGAGDGGRERGEGRERLT